MSQKFRICTKSSAKVPNLVTSGRVVISNGVIINSSSNRCISSLQVGTSKSLLYFTGKT
jgi:hypothetical protein